MSRPPVNMYRVSEALSEVMDDIGVNERLVMKRRRAMLLQETISTMTFHHMKKSTFIFGSQSEGSTTPGLHSDMDSLLSYKNINVIQSMSEWQPGVINYIMIQNENISPGYCYQQHIRPDLPLPATVNDVPDNILVHCVTDSEGRLLMKNFFTSKSMQVWPQAQIHGPALTFPEELGHSPTDRVLGWYCDSTLYQVTSWLQKQRECKWPSEDVLKDCRTSGCFVVPVGSKVHSPDILESELEWRISTSLQERHLMFSLNIPQLSCYILMKMILKTHIKPHVGDVLSSFMCKNVLLYCIAESSHDWHTANLLSNLHLCLFMLKECVKQRNCPHFIIPENNLLAGRLTEGQRGNLLAIIDLLLEDDELLLFGIQIDDIGVRLRMKLHMIPDIPNLPPSKLLSLVISYSLVHSNAVSLTDSLRVVLNEIKQGSLEMTQQYLSERCSILERYKSEGKLHNDASELLIPIISSALGSVIASADIDTHTAISDQAFYCLEAGKESDALSGKLKLISVLYCTGDIERAAQELENIQTQINILEVHTVCYCYRKVNSGFSVRSGHVFDNDEKAIKSNIAFCTRFLQCEINCIPHELRFEMLKSYMDEDRQIRTFEDSQWMDFIVVDSIPYGFFLEYKTYGHIRQLEALLTLATRTDAELDLGHKETALNLYGQCLGQENRQNEALKCYILSLQHRRRNNAARFLMCIQLLTTEIREHAINIYCLVVYL